MILREIQSDDLDVLYEQQREPEALVMAGFPSRDRDRFMAHWQKNILGSPSAAVRAVVTEGELVGYVSSWGAADRRLVAYWLGKPHWGRGIATTALRLYIDEHERVRPLHALVVPHNTGSIRVLEKCGFERVTSPGERATMLADDDDAEVLLILR